MRWTNQLHSPFTIALLILSLTLSLSSSALAQDVNARRVAVEQIPGRADSLIALDSGDVILLEPIGAQRTSRPMTKLTYAGGLYQLDPIIFGNPAWSNLRIDHVTQGSDQTLWAVGEDSVVYQRPNQSWQLIQLPSLNRRYCEDWGKFGVPCQMIVPVGADRAVTLRPVIQGGKIGTEVYAVEQGELRPLGSVVLPGVALGPVVKDGEGGFWVMLRRTVQTSNFKPMRGYLHYTANGEWKMWSDSGEVIEGTEFIGKTKFLIDPNVRKMASDGAGGFFALGQDRILYRTDKNGQSERFSSSQPNCQYCQPLAIVYDEKVNTLDMLIGEWREGEAGKVEVLGPTRWLEFDAKTGDLLVDEVVPMPAIPAEQQREFFSTVVISSEGESKWLSAPEMLLHRSRTGWDLLVKPEVIEKQEQLKQQQEYAEATNPTLAVGANIAQLGLVVAGVGGSTIRAWQVQNTGSAEDALTLGYGVPAIGALAGWYPAMYTVGYFDPAKANEAGRNLCLSTGLLGMTAANAAGVLFFGEAMRSESGRDTFAPGAVLGAVGGATIGTASGALLTGIVYRHSDKEVSPLVSGFVLSAVGASISSLAYFFLAPTWRPEKSSSSDLMNPLNNPLTF